MSNTKKKPKLDMDGDVIPEKLCNENWYEGRDAHVHFIKDQDNNTRALKCPNTKKWCTGMGYDTDPFTCAGCEEFDLWRINLAKNKSSFKKADDGKLQWSLMPFEQLEDVVRVLMKGAEKYGKDNWKNCDDVNRYKDALMRHVVSYNKGERNDPEDSLPHLAHAICNCLFLMYFNSVEDENIKKYLQMKTLAESEEVCRKK